MQESHTGSVQELHTRITSHNLDFNSVPALGQSFIEYNEDLFEEINRYYPEIMSVSDVSNSTEFSKRFCIFPAWECLLVEFLDTVLLLNNELSVPIPNIESINRAYGGFTIIWSPSNEWLRLLADGLYARSLNICHCCGIEYTTEIYASTVCKPPSPCYLLTLRVCAECNRNNVLKWVLRDI